MSLAASRSTRSDDPLWRLAILLGGGAILAGLLAGELVAKGHPTLVLALAVALLPVALWKRPSFAPAFIVASALTIEQFPQIAGSRTLDLTAHIPLFHGLGGFRPSDLLLLFLFAVYLAKRGADGVALMPRTPLSRLVFVFLGTVAFGVVLGVATGGVARVALTEARPFIYLGLAYVVASTMTTSRRALHAVLWAFVLGSGLKAVQGLFLFLSVRHVVPKPDAVLGHEESLFFGLFVLLTLALWLYDVRGSLRTTATAFLPIVLAADLANGRRTAWLILPAGLLAVMAVGFVSLPRKRGFLGRIGIGLALVSAVYFPAYWNKTGGFAQPARAFHSVISPDSRDASSNLYRVQEDANLKFNIKQASPLGKGFGHRIDYALPIANISDIDPYIAYVPHNGVFYLFLRIGTAGAIAFWSMLGLGIIAACRLARNRDKELAVVGTLVACALPAYVLLGENDQGFFYYRVAFVMGALLGLLEAARRLSPAEPPAVSALGTAARLETVTPPRVLAPAVAVAATASAQTAVATISRLPSQPATARPLKLRRLPRAETKAQRRARLVATAALPVAAGVLIWLLTTGGSHSSRAGTTASAVIPPATSSGQPKAGAIPHQPVAPAHVVIAAAPGSRGSWIEVRLGSATGRRVFSGVVKDGDSRRYTARRLWVRFGAAGNVDVVVNGKPVRFTGTLETVITARGARP
jgi:Domain of unknown function (DUF4115)